MICCEHCRSERFLQIEKSRTYCEDDRVLEITEHMVCTWCDLTGTVEYDLERDTVAVSGGLVRDTTTRPNTVREKRGEPA